MSGSLNFVIFAHHGVSSSALSSAGEWRLSASPVTQKIIKLSEDLQLS